LPVPSEITYPQAAPFEPPFVREQDIETALVEKLRGLKYTERSDIRDRAALETNFRGKFEALNRVRLTDAEFEPPSVPVETFATFVDEHADK
jgi:type I restriction enzyme R subunit